MISLGPKVQDTNVAIERARLLFGVKARRGAFIAFSVVLLLFAPAPAAAIDGVWLSFIGPGDWNTGANWSGGIAPANPGDTATFNIATLSVPTLSDDVTIESITFSPGAGGFTIRTGTNTLTVQGAGIINKSGNVQTIINGSSPAGGALFSSTQFNDSATASDVSIINDSFGETSFRDTSSAGDANISHFARTV